MKLFTVGPIDCHPEVLEAKGRVIEGMAKVSSGFLSICLPEPVIRALFI